MNQHRQVCRWTQDDTLHDRQADSDLFALSVSPSRRLRRRPELGQKMSWVPSLTRSKLSRRLNLSREGFHGESGSRLARGTVVTYSVRNVSVSAWTDAGEDTDLYQL